MTFLLDTCTFLWLTVDSPRLSEKARSAVETSATPIFLSAVSMAELSILHALGRHSASAQSLVGFRKAMQIMSLALSEEATAKLDSLPPCHRDPFDRLLACQAVVHGLTLVTPDKVFDRYGIKRLW